MKIPPKNHYQVEQIQSIDLYHMIFSINPAYVDPTRYSNPHEARVNCLYYSRSEGKLYIIFANAYIFSSEDNLKSLNEVIEVNYDASRELIPNNSQSLDAVVETVDGSIIFAGRDRRTSDSESGIVWRKPIESSSFSRYVVVTDPAWKTSLSGNMTSGYFGDEPRKMVALAIYASSDAHFFYSFDDGLTWKRHKMGKQFKKHVHEVYLPSSVGVKRKARLWVSGGDDTSGNKSGLLYIDSTSWKGLGKPHWVFREKPGYRLVGLHGNGKNVFVGNESVAGGMLKIQDNLESIDKKDFEYVLGKSQHDYHLFRSLYSTSDGILTAGTSSYREFAGDTIRADSGGFIYVSNNEGATYTEIPLGETFITSVAYDGASFWYSTSANRESGGDFSKKRFRVLKLPKPSAFAVLTSPYICKAVLVDSSAFYKFAGDPNPPKASLAPNDRTLKVDLCAYKSVVLVVETFNAGSLAIEAVPFYNWSLETTPWYDIESVTLDGPEKREIPIPHTAQHNRWFRVRNSGSGSIEIKFLAFIGKI